MVLQWALILGLSLLVLSLMRQLGELSMRIYGVPEKPKETYDLFAELPETTVTLVDKRKFTFGGDQLEPALIVFFSPSCGACAGLPEAVREFRKKQPVDMKLLIVLKQIDRRAVINYISEQSLGEFNVTTEHDFPKELDPGGAPFGVSIASGGKIAAHGKPKILLHLLEMSHAAMHFAHMAMDHSRRQHEWGESAPFWDPHQIPAAVEAEPELTTAR